MGQQIGRIERRQRAREGPAHGQVERFLLDERDEAVADIHGLQVPERRRESAANALVERAVRKQFHDAVGDFQLAQRTQRKRQTRANSGVQLRPFDEIDEGVGDRRVIYLSDDLREIAAHQGVYRRIDEESHDIRRPWRRARDDDEVRNRRQDTARKGGIAEQGEQPVRQAGQVNFLAACSQARARVYVERLVPRRIKEHFHRAGRGTIGRKQPRSLHREDRRPRNVAVLNDSRGEVGLDAHLSQRGEHHHADVRGHRVRYGETDEGVSDGRSADAHHELQRVALYGEVRHDSHKLAQFAQHDGSQNRRRIGHSDEDRGGLEQIGASQVIVCAQHLAQSIPRTIVRLRVGARALSDSAFCDLCLFVHEQSPDRLRPGQYRSTPNIVAGTGTSQLTHAQPLVRRMAPTLLLAGIRDARSRQLRGFVRRGMLVSDVHPPAIEEPTVLISQNMHTHTRLSYCGGRDSTVANTVAEAESVGLSLVGISDHIDVVESGREVLMAQNREELALIETDIEVLIGSEVSLVDPDTLAIAPECVDDLDYMLVSANHFHVPGVLNPDDRSEAGYADWFLTMAEGAINLGASIIPHPFSYIGGLATRNHGAPLDIVKVLAAYDRGKVRKLFRRAAEVGTAFEFNPGHVRGHREFFGEILLIARDEGTKFSFGSDGHHPGAMDYGGPEKLAENERMFREIGVTEDDICQAYRVRRN